MTLPSEIGEDMLITRLVSKLKFPDRVLIGPGDDCAVIDLPGMAKVQLLKTDTIIEGVHFLADTSPARIGWKAMARAISDVAAMGGTPDAAVISLSLPPGTTVERLEDIYEGIARCASRFDVAVAGGETSSTEGPLTISVAMTGYVLPDQCVLRSTGEPGDILMVTGFLGGSLEGHHLDFVPRMRQARWLVENFVLNGMMDLSDGLGKDLPRLAAASRCGYYLNDTLLPVRSGCSVQQAMNDGEDYELLIAMSPNQADVALNMWPKKFPHIPLTPIGSLAQRLAPDEMPEPALGGYDHFAPETEPGAVY